MGEAFAAAIATVSSTDATKEERNAVKDVLDAINNDLNTELGENCVDEGETGEE